MNYTEVYRSIYSLIKKAEIPHEVTHNISIRITDAISDLHIYVSKNCSEVLPEIKEIIQTFWASN